MQPETRLEKIFSTLDLKPIISRLPRKHNGPRGYNAKYKLRALIAAKIEQIPTMAALVRRLKNDPVFRYICGFGVIASVPSEATMSRFLRELTETGILKELFNSLVNKAEQMGIIDCTSISNRFQQKLRLMRKPSLESMYRKTVKALTGASKETLMATLKPGLATKCMLLWTQNQSYQ
ncbi:transposase [Syntrophaceticus schinkii]|nr:transposase [Syntrophaceticus schinkii]